MAFHSMKCIAVHMTQNDDKIFCLILGDVNAWKRFLYYWPLVKGIYRSPEESWWCRVLMFSLRLTWNILNKTVQVRVIPGAMPFMWYHCDVVCFFHHSNNWRYYYPWWCHLILLSNFLLSLAILKLFDENVCLKSKIAQIVEIVAPVRQRPVCNLQ